MKVTVTFSGKTSDGTFPTEVSASIEIDEDANVHVLEERLMEVCRAAMVASTYHINSVQKVFDKFDR
jgi:hypothetical protein